MARRVAPLSLVDEASTSLAFRQPEVREITIEELAELLKQLPRGEDGEAEEGDEIDQIPAGEAMNVTKYTITKPLYYAEDHEELLPEDEEEIQQRRSELPSEVLSALEYVERVPIEARSRALNSLEESLDRILGYVWPFDFSIGNFYAYYGLPEDLKIRYGPASLTRLAQEVDTETIKESDELEQVLLDEMNHLFSSRSEFLPPPPDSIRKFKYVDKLYDAARILFKSIIILHKDEISDAMVDKQLSDIHKVADAIPNIKITEAKGEQSAFELQRDENEFLEALSIDLVDSPDIPDPLHRLEYAMAILYYCQVDNEVLGELSEIIHGICNELEETLKRGILPVLGGDTDMSDEFRLENAIDELFELRLPPPFQVPDTAFAMRQQETSKAIVENLDKILYKDIRFAKAIHTQNGMLDNLTQKIVPIAHPNLKKFPFLKELKLQYDEDKPVTYMKRVALHFYFCLMKEGVELDNLDSALFKVLELRYGLNNDKATAFFNNELVVPKKPRKKKPVLQDDDATESEEELIQVQVEMKEEPQRYSPVISQETKSEIQDDFYRTHPELVGVSASDPRLIDANDQYVQRLLERYALRAGAKRPRALKQEEDDDVVILDEWPGRKNKQGRPGSSLVSQMRKLSFTFTRR